MNRVPIRSAAPSASRPRRPNPVDLMRPSPDRLVGVCVVQDEGSRSGTWLSLTLEEGGTLNARVSDCALDRLIEVLDNARQRRRIAKEASHEPWLCADPA